jgi:hypothetical protein
VEVELRLFLMLVLDGGEYSVVSLLLYMKEIRLAVATEQEGVWAPYPICNFGKTEKSRSTLVKRTRFLCPQPQTVKRRLATGYVLRNASLGDFVFVRTS